MHLYPSTECLDYVQYQEQVQYGQCSLQFIECILLLGVPMKLNVLSHQVVQRSCCNAETTDESSVIGRQTQERAYFSKTLRYRPATYGFRLLWLNFDAITGDDMTKERYFAPEQLQFSFN